MLLFIALHKAWNLGIEGKQTGSASVGFFLKNEEVLKVLNYKELQLFCLSVKTICIPYFVMFQLKCAK